VEGQAQLNGFSRHNRAIPATAIIELPQSLYDRLRERSETSGAFIPTLIVQAVESANAAPEKATPKTRRRVTLPLISAGSKRGPLYPVDENPHGLVFS
jgi:hypothetical protein